MTDHAQGYWGKRILGELRYAFKLSEVKQKQEEFHPIIRQAANVINQQIVDQGAISKDSVLKAEQIMQPLAEQAKQYTINCVAHAHIDMNWMWGWHETVSITLDTFRTMLGGHSISLGGSR